MGSQYESECDKSLFLPSRNKPYSSRIGICKLLTSQQLRQNTDDGSTLHIEFDLSHNSKNPHISYETADNMGFLPRNSYKTVDKLCKRLQFDANEVIQICPSDDSVAANFTFPQISTIRNLFVWFLDVNGAPGKRLLETLANNFTRNSDEKEALLKMCDRIQEEVIDKHLTLLDVLNRFKSIRIDVGSLIEILKPLQPRLY